MNWENFVKIHNTKTINFSQNKKIYCKTFAGLGFGHIFFVLIEIFEFHALRSNFTTSFWEFKEKKIYIFYLWTTPSSYNGNLFQETILLFYCKSFNWQEKNYMKLIKFSLIFYSLTDFRLGKFVMKFPVKHDFFVFQLIFWKWGAFESLSDIHWFWKSFLRFFRNRIYSDHKRQRNRFS